MLGLQLCHVRCQPHKVTPASSPDKVLIGFLLSCLADCSAGFVALQHAILQQLAGLGDLAELQLQLVHLLLLLPLQHLKQAAKGSCTKMTNPPYSSHKVCKPFHAPAF